MRDLIVYIGVREKKEGSEMLTINISKVSPETRAKMTRLFAIYSYAAKVKDLRAK